MYRWLRCSTLRPTYGDNGPTISGKLQRPVKGGDCGISARGKNSAIPIPLPLAAFPIPHFFSLATSNHPGIAATHAPQKCRGTSAN